MRKLPEQLRVTVGDNAEFAHQTATNATDAQRSAFNRVPVNAADGSLVTAVKMVSGTNPAISHKLGRKPTGWLVLRSTGAAAALYEVSSDDKTIIFSSTGTPTVWLWFF